VDGMEVLAEGFLGFGMVLLWLFLWVLTLGNPFKSGLSEEVGVRVFRFDGQSRKRWPRIMPTEKAFRPQL